MVPAGPSLDCNSAWISFSSSRSLKVCWKREVRKLYLVALMSWIRVELSTLCDRRSSSSDGSVTLEDPFFTN